MIWFLFWDFFNIIICYICLLCVGFLMYIPRLRLMMKNIFFPKARFYLFRYIYQCLILWFYDFGFIWFIFWDLYVFLYVICVLIFRVLHVYSDLLFMCFFLGFFMYILRLFLMMKNISFWGKSILWVGF